MRRRDLIALLGGAAVAYARPLRAQQRIARIGILVLGPQVAPKELALVSELAKLGYVEGRNVSYEVRGVDGDFSRLPTLSRALVATKPDVLVGASEVVADAMAAVTADIPIVLTVMGDPIAIGLTDSMSRPSRNVTGFTLSSPTLSAKRLELLHELIPGLSKVAYVSAPIGPMYNIFQQQVRSAASALALTLFSVSVTNEASVAEGFAIAARENVQAVMVETSPSNVRLSAHIIDECLLRDLPAIHPWYFDVRAGALMSYGPTVLENYSGAAKYVDRILKGAKVAELPIQEPTQFKLAINLRMARAIKLTIPAMLLARADEVME
jgi:putative ABC transport system substrate-binding protein